MKNLGTGMKKIVIMTRTEITIYPGGQTYTKATSWINDSETKAVNQESSFKKKKQKEIEEKKKEEEFKKEQKQLEPVYLGVIED